MKIQVEFEVTEKLRAIWELVHNQELTEEGMFRLIEDELVHCFRNMYEEGNMCQDEALYKNECLTEFDVIWLDSPEGK
jgi:hypothetical protein